MKFTKKLYEGATLYGNDMHVKDIDVLPDATEFKFLGEAPYTGIKYYYLLDINKSFPNVRRIYIDKNVRGIQMNNQLFPNVEEIVSDNDTYKNTGAGAYGYEKCCGNYVYGFCWMQKCKFRQYEV